MLILTRKEGETITIGEDIQIKVLAVQGGKVRLGIDAPREVRVNREEVLSKNKPSSQA
jgi:carbon storage regulator